MCRIIGAWHAGQFINIQPHKNDNEIMSVSLIFNTNLSFSPN
jgi:hypothetical protein